MPVSKRENGRWRFRVWVTLPSGVRKRLTGTPQINTKKAAEHAERQAVRDALDPEQAERRRRAAAAMIEKEVAPTLESYSVAYIENTKARLKPSTARAQKHICDKHIVPLLGHLRVDEIRQSHVDEFSSYLLAGDEKKNRPALSRKTVNNVLSVVSTILKYALKNDVIDRLGVKCHIKAQSPEMEIVSQEDLGKLLAAATDLRYKVVILLASEAGLRSGEILALRWQDVADRELRVVQSMDRSGEFTSPKSWAARTVPLSSALSEALKALPETGETVLVKLKKDEPLGYYALHEKMRAIYKAAGVNRPRMPIHSMRHSFCSRLAERGTPIHVIKELAGHQSIETTLRYMHTSRAALQDAVAGAFDSSGPGSQEFPEGDD